MAGVTPYAGIVPAGGESRRLGGVDKARLEAGGATFLDHVLAALAGASRRVVVGPPRPVGTPVEFVREDPPGGGPAAGLGAALAGVTADVVAVVAVDLPLVDRASVERLVQATSGDDVDGALLVDVSGTDQPLAAAYRCAALRDALGPAPAGTSMRAVLRGLRLRRLPDDAGVCVDAGTWEGVATVRRRLLEREDRDAGGVGGGAGPGPGDRLRR